RRRSRHAAAARGHPRRDPRARRGRRLLAAATLVLRGKAAAVRRLVRGPGAAPVPAPGGPVHGRPRPRTPGLRPTGARPRRVADALHDRFARRRAREGTSLRGGFLDGRLGLLLAWCNAAGTWHRYRIAGRLRHARTDENAGN